MFQTTPRVSESEEPRVGAPAASSFHRRGARPGAPGWSPGGRSPARGAALLWQAAFPKGRCVPERVPGLDCSSCHPPHEQFVLEPGSFRKAAILANSVSGQGGEVIGNADKI